MGWTGLLPTRRMGWTIFALWEMVAFYLYRMDIPIYVESVGDIPRAFGILGNLFGLFPACFTVFTITIHALLMGKECNRLWQWILLPMAFMFSAVAIVTGFATVLGLTLMFLTCFTGWGLLVMIGCLVGMIIIFLIWEWAEKQISRLRPRFHSCF